jgi:hypothetical protein
MQRTLEHAQSSNSRSNKMHAVLTWAQEGDAVCDSTCTAGDGLIVAHAMCAAQRCSLLIPLLHAALSNPPLPDHQ